MPDGGMRRRRSRSSKQSSRQRDARRSQTKQPLLQRLLSSLPFRRDRAEREAPSPRAVLVKRIVALAILLFDIYLIGSLLTERTGLLGVSARGALTATFGGAAIVPLAFIAYICASIALQRRIPRPIGSTLGAVLLFSCMALLLGLIKIAYGTSPSSVMLEPGSIGLSLASSLFEGIGALGTLLAGVGSACLAMVCFGCTGPFAAAFERTSGAVRALIGSLFKKKQMIRANASAKPQRQEAEREQERGSEPEPEPDPFFAEDGSKLSEQQEYEMELELKARDFARSIASLKEEPPAPPATIHTLDGRYTYVNEPDEVIRERSRIRYEQARGNLPVHAPEAEPSLAADAAEPIAQQPEPEQQPELAAVEPEKTDQPAPEEFGIEAVRSLLDRAAEKLESVGAQEPAREPEQIREPDKIRELDQMHAHDKMRELEQMREPEQMRELEQTRATESNIIKLDIQEDPERGVQALPAAGSGGAEPPGPFAQSPERAREHEQMRELDQMREPDQIREPDQMREPASNIIKLDIQEDPERGVQALPAAAPRGAELSDMFSGGAEPPGSFAQSPERAPLGEDLAVLPTPVEVVSVDEVEYDESVRAPRGHFPPPVELYGEETEFDAGVPREMAIEWGDRIIDKLAQFGIEAQLAETLVGPTVIQFRIQPLPGVKINKIVGLSNDLALALAVESVRVEAPIPGKPYVGIEIPNPKRRGITLRSVIEDDAFAKSEKALPLPMGVSINGDAKVIGLEELPHLLVAGTTGSGKSVFVNGCIVGLCSKRTPQELRMVLIDPKRVEMAIYDKLPHLLTPPVTEPKKAVHVLGWAVREMDRRYSLCAAAKVRNIASYNEMVLPKDRLPHIVIVVDEFADLMMTAAKDVEDHVIRLAQMARAIGIHLVIATQRPSVQVITGIIKANIPARASFTLASAIDSRTILDAVGAEKLLGKGDMLFQSTQDPKPLRIQSPWIDERAILNWLDYLNGLFGEPDFIDIEEQGEGGGAADAKFDDPMFEDAVHLVLTTGTASASWLQRRMRVGFSRASRLIDMMEMAGIIGPSEGAKPREILVQEDEADEIIERTKM